MFIQMSANVDVECRHGSLQMSMEMSKIYRFMTGKKPTNPTIICWKNAESHVDIYLYIYEHTHTHAHKKAHFSSIFTRKSAKNIGTDSKKCQCRLKGPANVEHMSMSMVPVKCRPDMVDFCIHPHWRLQTLPVLNPLDFAFLLVRVTLLSLRQQGLQHGHLCVYWSVDQKIDLIDLAIFSSQESWTIDFECSLELNWKSHLQSENPT